VTFTEIKLQNAHNDEVAGRNDQAENRFCSEDYPLRGESCSSCDGIWDEVNVLCGELGDHWVGSPLSGYCTDCSNTAISCYCICTEGTCKNSRFRVLQRLTSLLTDFYTENLIKMISFASIDGQQNNLLNRFKKYFRDFWQNTCF
jgi:hypothetical protein